ncbi:MAG: hypothetical protein H6621_01415 [Halobacteriovoraceae bacterium]|nr:hypothetical protein [Halobacteriovoraceae bacterium]
MKPSMVLIYAMALALSATSCSKSKNSNAHLAKKDTKNSKVDPVNTSNSQNKGDKGNSDLNNGPVVTYDSNGNEVTTERIFSEKTDNYVDLVITKTQDGDETLELIKRNLDDPDCINGIKVVNGQNIDCRGVIVKKTYIANIKARNEKEEKKIEEAKDKFRLKAKKYLNNGDEEILDAEEKAQKDLEQAQEEADRALEKEKKAQQKAADKKSKKLKKEANQAKKDAEKAQKKLNKVQNDIAQYQNDIAEAQEIYNTAKTEQEAQEKILALVKKKNVEVQKLADQKVNAKNLTEDQVREIQRKIELNEKVIKEAEKALDELAGVKEETAKKQAKIQKAQEILESAQTEQEAQEKILALVKEKRAEVVALKNETLQNTKMTKAEIADNQAKMDEANQVLKDAEVALKKLGKAQNKTAGAQEKLQTAVANKKATENELQAHASIKAQIEALTVTIEQITAELKNQDTLSQKEIEGLQAKLQETLNAKKEAEAKISDLVKGASEVGDGLGTLLIERPDSVVVANDEAEALKKLVDGNISDLPASLGSCLLDNSFGLNDNLLDPRVSKFDLLDVKVKGINLFREVDIEIAPLTDFENHSGVLALSLNVGKNVGKFSTFIGDTEKLIYAAQDYQFVSNDMSEVLRVKVTQVEDTNKQNLKSTYVVVSDLEIKGIMLVERNLKNDKEKTYCIKKIGSYK